MNTPAHAVINLALLGRSGRPDDVRPILAGAIACDLPMFGFYLWQRLAVGAPEALIWGEAYFRPSWQGLFDVFNSVPLALLGLAVAAWRRSRAGALFFASMLLHVALDLPLHREDAHRHFLPLSDWRFVSPVSYWDPAHHGAIAALAEGVAVFAASAILWRRHSDPLGRAALVGGCALYAAAYAFFYLFFFR